MIKWLLRNNAALIGDLAEERASGRSKAWYFRQVLVAIARLMISDSRSHPVLLARAAATASLSYLVMACLTAIATGVLYGYFSTPEYWGEAGPLSLWTFFPMALIPSTFTGWLVARTHRTCAPTALVAMILMWVFAMVPSPNWFAAVLLPGLMAGALLQMKGDMRRYERST